MKSWYCRNNLRKQLQLLTIFAKCSILGCSTGFWIYLGFWFWIYQGSEYSWVTQGSEFTWIISKHVWICLNMSKCVWMCLNLHEWLLFYFLMVTSMFIQNWKLYSEGIRDCFHEETKFDFSYSWLKYLICLFFVLD